jgi:EmrB/QacA subfamily drug resistance transporter
MSLDLARTPSSAPSTAHAPRLSPLAQAGLLAGPFLSMLDSNIVNVALPAIATQLKTSLATAQWIISGYLLALAAGLAASAYLAKRFGTRRVYLASLLGFTLASAACALAPSIGVLIALRVAQGLLGAPLVPLAMNMLLGDGSARQQMPAAAGVLLFLAPAVGPTAGGFLIHIAGWPLVFLVNVPFGLLGALGMLRVPEPPVHASDARDASVPVDPFGMLALAGGLVLATYGATEGPQVGWSSLSSWPYLATGGLLLLVYVVWALRRPHPAVDLKLLRHLQPALAVGLCALSSIVMFAILVLVPVFMEDLQGATALTAGLALLPQGLVMGIGIVLGDRLAAHRGARFSALLGFLLLAITTATLLALTLTTPAWVTALLLSGRGVAVGLTIQPLLVAMIRGLAPAEVPDGNTLFNAAERLAGSIGIPLLVTFFTLREQDRIRETLDSLGVHLGARLPAAGSAAQLPQAVRARLAQAAVTGFHDTIWLLVAVSLLGCLVALLLRRGPASSSASVAAASTDAA